MSSSYLSGEYILKFIIIGIILLFVICAVGVVSLGILFVILKLLGVKIDISKLWSKKTHVLNFLKSVLPKVDKYKKMLR